MSRRNRTASHFKPRHEESFSKSTYMYPNQRHLSFRSKPLASTGDSFYQMKQRSLNNSVLDYKQQLVQTAPDVQPFKEAHSV